MAVKTKSRSMLKQYEDHLEDRLRLVEDAGAGVPAGTVYELMETTHLNKDFFAGILNISTKTLDRYRQRAKLLSPAGSEIVLKLYALFKKGEELFGNREEFMKWIEKPAYGLGFRIPKAMMQTSSGVDLVMEELTRIEFGDLA
jgi:putative toxin-antitoxin system antitoxin component (TIGR02293 family)